MRKNTHSNRPTNRYLLIAILVVALVGFLTITLARPCFDGVNVSVNAWMSGIQTGSLTEPAKILDYIFDTKILLVISLPFVGVLLYKGFTEKATLLIGAMGADAVILQATKTLIVSPRPLNALIPASDYSFPSGHVTTLIVFMGMLTYLAWQNRRTISKLCAAAIGPLIAIIAFDRLYLNVHWFTDILAAPFLALFIIAATILVIQQLFRLINKRHSNQSAPLRGSSNH